MCMCAVCVCVRARARTHTCFLVLSQLGLVFFDLQVADGGGEAGRGDGAAGALSPKFVVREVGSRTNVFVSGSDIEYRMMQWCEKHKNFASSMLSSKSALFKLRKEVRSAMKTLTVADEATIEADAVVAGEDLQLTLTREDLERECEDVFQAVPRLIELLLGDVQRSCPAEVVVVGGAMRIPRAQKVLGAFLEEHGAVLRKTVDMDRGIATGTALVSALVTGVSSLCLPLSAEGPYSEAADRVLVKMRADGSLAGGGGRAAVSGAEQSMVAALEGECAALKLRNKQLSEGEVMYKDQLFQNQTSIRQLEEQVTRLQQQLAARNRPVDAGQEQQLGGSGDAGLKAVAEEGREGQRDALKVREPGHSPVTVESSVHL